MTGDRSPRLKKLLAGFGRREKERPAEERREAAPRPAKFPIKNRRKIN